MLLPLIRHGLLVCLNCSLSVIPAVASQPLNLAQVPAIPPQDVNPNLPFPPEIPEPQPESIPSPPELLLPETEAIPEGIPGEIAVTRFEFAGNTAFSSEELGKLSCKEGGATLASVNEQNPCSLSLNELIGVAARVSEFYKERGYGTSGAIIVIPEATREVGKGTVIVEVIEGELEEIRIVALEDSLRLNPNYARSRLELATSKPLNINRLQEALQLLQLNPLIERVSANLADGTEPGKSILTVVIEEAPTFQPQILLDNSRSPSVGSFRRGVEVRENNLLGWGDGISLNYINTDGSNALDFRYALPLGPRNGTLSLNYSWTDNKVIDPLFERLEITSYSRFYAVTLRQPLLQTIQNRTTFQEFAVGLTGSVRESQSFLLGIPFPFSPGANAEGYTKIAALRFFQEWTLQNPVEVLAFRSQLNFGWDAFDATINESLPPSTEFIPDSRFFAWQGQGQWVRLLAPDALFVLRANLQLADRPLVPSEQFALGGFGSVRAYRQDFLLADSGLFASAELRLPILRIPEWQGVLQVIPFVDYGVGWNLSGRLAPDLDPNTLAAVGLGLQWQQSDRVTARFEWGMPLVRADVRERTWQENGLYFSVQIRPF
jgi:hemolysin activation/secretion protein